MINTVNTMKYGISTKSQPNLIKCQQKSETIICVKKLLTERKYNNSPPHLIYATTALTHWLIHGRVSVWQADAPGLELQQKQICILLLTQHKSTCAGNWTQDLQLIKLLATPRFRDLSIAKWFPRFPYLVLRQLACDFTKDRWCT